MIQLKKEHLKAEKETVNKGEVKVRKEVHTEHKQITVPVEHEEVVIERRAANGRKAGSAAMEAEEIRIPTKEERVHVSKESVVKEEVSVGKRKVRGTETVTGDVQEEELVVETEGDAKVRQTNKPAAKSKAFFDSRRAGGNSHPLSFLFTNVTAPGAATAPSSRRRFRACPESPGCQGRQGGYYPSFFLYGDSGQWMQSSRAKRRSSLNDLATQVTTLEDLNGLMRTMMKTRARPSMLNTEMDVHLGRRGPTEATNTPYAPTVRQSGTPALRRRPVPKIAATDIRVRPSAVIWATSSSRRPAIATAASSRN